MVYLPVWHLLNIINIWQPPLTMESPNRLNKSRFQSPYCRSNSLKSLKLTHVLVRRADMAWFSTNRNLRWHQTAHLTVCSQLKSNYMPIIWQLVLVICTMNPSRISQELPEHLLWSAWITGTLSGLTIWQAASGDRGYIPTFRVLCAACITSTDITRGLK